MKDRERVGTASGGRTITDEGIIGDHARSIWLFFVFLHFSGVGPYICAARLEIPSLLLLLWFITRRFFMRAACEPSFCFGESMHTLRGSRTRVMYSGRVYFYYFILAIRSGISWSQLAYLYDFMYLQPSNVCTPGIYYMHSSSLREYICSTVSIVVFQYSNVRRCGCSNSNMLAAEMLVRLCQLEWYIIMTCEPLKITPCETTLAAIGIYTSVDSHTGSIHTVHIMNVQEKLSISDTDITPTPTLLTDLDFQDKLIVMSILLCIQRIASENVFMTSCYILQPSKAKFKCLFGTFVFLTPGVEDLSQWNMIL